MSATYCICLYTRPSTSWICITMWGVGHFFWRRTWIVSFFCLYLWDGILFRVNNSLHRMLIDNLSLLDLTITWMNFVHLKSVIYVFDYMYNICKLLKYTGTCMYIFWTLAEWKPFKQIYFFDLLNILHIIRLLSNFNHLDIKLSFGNQKYTLLSVNYHYNGKLICIFHIKAFYY
jgi:hypothetical protein